MRRRLLAWFNVAHEHEIDYGPIAGGLTLIPYQFAVGVSLRPWPCLSTVALSVYMGPLKLWLYWNRGRDSSGRREDG